MANEKRLIWADDALAAEFTIEEDGAIAYVVDSEVIRRLPTVDAVEVVRCKNCVLSNYHESSGLRKCTSQRGLNRIVDDEEFCSWGEREESDHV